MTIPTRAVRSIRGLRQLALLVRLFLEDLQYLVESVGSPADLGNEIGGLFWGHVAGSGALERRTV